MEITYLVDALSAIEIELDSAEFLTQYQPDVLFRDITRMDAEKLLDDIYQDRGMCLRIVSDEELPNGILGASEMDLKVIKIRKADYDNCRETGSSRMTIAHEVAHSRLHLGQFEKNGMRMYQTQSKHIPAYVSSEWQARVWASSVMMPFPALIRLLNKVGHKTKEEIVQAIEDRFGVSSIAAQVRFETIQRYYRDGRYEKLMNRMKEMKYM
ncbi:MAG: ImmA/IrrE family metallo-endopeptidase [Sphaerochaetaceae bacterium]|nr:ImmA/IrrE family metallo-endopeptidase [Sphaerochaetaceae bacterium]